LHQLADLNEFVELIHGQHLADHLGWIHGGSWVLGLQLGYEKFQKQVARIRGWIGGCVTGAVVCVVGGAGARRHCMIDGCRGVRSD